MAVGIHWSASWTGISEEKWFLNKLWCVHVKIFKSLVYCIQNVYYKFLICLRSDHKYSNFIMRVILQAGTHNLSLPPRLL